MGLLSQVSQSVHLQVLKNNNENRRRKKKRALLSVVWILPTVNQDHGVYPHGYPSPCTFNGLAYSLFHAGLFCQRYCVLPPTRPPERITKPVLMGRAVSQGPPLSHSERGKAHTPSSPSLRVIAMADRRIPRDCCPLPAVIRMCQTVSPALPCYNWTLQTKCFREKKSIFFLL
ncbi:UNVERIFIED_CONTAM: hypothetical protein FKN15_052972 [Acipenser sinensis]